MDVFVLPSYREGLGISIIEASATERPIVATDIRGCREAVDNNKTGILVPVKDSEKLAQAIIYLLRNPDIAREMGKQGREKALKEFDENMVFGRIKVEYERLIKEKLK
jgi:glycosyltransferase involved in cell wall biosynthesis